ncbi:hypothetical protein HBI56_230980 [Parastagonospora nodorum]|uniref:Rhodopsin domain-containing protein n=2 Tax=Phaeosphaeria nodorum (strain SN15 / ATCC MYA-4574 / FGSC 10173) TaxID=321614 RepID=A0A7U2FHI2_PHANO|nr:hypothetical protein SNOG_16142 [Parastagonospora nodorum SN15]KAH3905105.1 hypothetical protein HBH56_223920 [Parastagonospora nodorum]EAT76514.1 hypothetical protein SNOG_16142 [Parastagonospora nodorum SN15]KAH3921955.1 hypothetical protein HBH54_232070 [Parastagonospora nodorum]KAH3939393.1 hypothetical protein HBH53_234730 [Parastagonospora nodorum]KAH3957240.1 hypothetical protein HBH51_228100 [Parastagonospora nodorum]
MATSVSPEHVVPIEAVLLSLAILIASGRLLPRLAQRAQPTASDSFLIASILNAIGLFVTDVMTYKWGGMAGDDAPEPPTAQLIALKKVQFAGNAFYDTGIYLPKLAILALYFRLVPVTMPWLRKALYAISTLTVGAMISTFFLDTFWCGRDPSPNWSVEEGSCSTFTSKEVFRIDWAMNITSDVFIFMLPFPLLHQLQLNRRQIWGLVATFSLGAVTIAMSIVRFATIEIIYAWTNVFVLSMAEMAVAIMVVSLPSMRHWLRRGGIFSSNKNESSSSRSKYGLRTPIVGSNGFTRPMIRGKPSGRGPIDEDSGSEVELNIMGRKDVIYETRRISVEFSNSADYGASRSGKLS